MYKSDYLPYESRKDLIGFRMHYVYTNQKPLSRIPDSQIRQKLIRKPQHSSKSLNISHHPKSSNQSIHDSLSTFLIFNIT